MRENLEILASAPAEKLLERLSKEASTAKKLKYGFEAELSRKDRTTAKVLNSVYESLVWGKLDDADHQGLASDEANLIKRWIRGSVYSANVAEVGSGSGRISRHLIPVCERLSLIEREALALGRSRTRLRGAVGPEQLRTVKFINADFGSTNSGLEKHSKFSAILLLENLIGMNPLEEDRRTIIKNAEKLLQVGGIAVFAHRVRPDISKGIRFQVMPYEFTFRRKLPRTTVGFAINWSATAIQKEIQATSRGLQIVDYLQGASRPAGGTMNYVVVRKIV